MSGIDPKKDVTKTKLELDVERHVLGTTVNLSDGTVGHVFSRSPTKNDSKVYTYNCHLCAVPNLPGERCLQTHIAGRKHQTKLSMPIIDADSFRAPLLRVRNQISMQIAPGEPVPPGFENEVKQVAKIQSTIDKCKEQALVGLEYIMELVMGDPIEPFYHCVLCDKHCDPRTILIHIESYNHRLKFLEKHFSTVIREIAPYRFNQDAREIMPRIVQTICESIEDTYGRLTPNVHDNNLYKKNRMRYYQDVINDKHFDEKLGTTFVNVIDRKAIQDAITLGTKKELPAIASKKRDPSPPKVSAPKVLKTDKSRSIRNSLDSVSSISSSSFSKSRSRSPEIIVIRSQSRSPPQIKASIQQFRDRDKDRRNKQIDNRDKSRRFSPEKKQMAPSPRELEKQAIEIEQERYKWEKFRFMVELAVGELDKKLKGFEKNPESHPLYPDEWKKYWMKRYKELQAEKKDHVKHDFKPEWIIFWSRRMKELHMEEVEKKKLEIRKKLNLPADGKERTDELKQQYAIKVKTATNAEDVNKTKRDKVKMRSKSPAYDRKNNRGSRVGDRDRERSDRNDRNDRERNERERNERERNERERNERERNERERIEHNERMDRSDRIDRIERNERIDRIERNERREFRSPSHGRYPRDVPEALPRERYIREPPPEFYRHEPPRGMYRETWQPSPRYPYYTPPRAMHPAHMHPPHGAQAPYYRPPHEQYRDGENREGNDNNEPLTVVSVLRLLTALEELLGSLGPKVIDLLAKALALEKVKANSADDMLLNDDNCVIFETVKEKLKGQLIADVIEKNKINAVKRAIKYIASVIHIVNEKNKSKPKEVNDNQKLESIVEASASTGVSTTVIVPPSQSVSNTEKSDIAAKIAAALYAQGKTDVTGEELEQLINVYINMSKKAKESNSIVTTATYLSEINPKEKTEENNETTENAAKKTEENKLAEELQKKNEVEEDDDDLPADASSALESLTDSDLQTLLQNFKDLSTDEQQHLIAYLKKLEATSPVRVEKLRKYVNVDIIKVGIDKTVDKTTPIENASKEKLITAAKPELVPPKKTVMSDLMDDIDFARNADNLTTAAASSSSSNNKRMIESDEDDDDYSYDDVVRAASKNVKDKQIQDNLKIVQESLQREREGDLSNASQDSSNSTSSANLKLSIADTQNLIANLMGSLQKNTQGTTTLSNTNSNNKSPNKINTITTISTSGPQPIINATPAGNIPFYQQQSTYYSEQNNDYANIPFLNNNNNINNNNNNNINNNINNVNTNNNINNVNTNNNINNINNVNTNNNNNNNKNNTSNNNNNNNNNNFYPGFTGPTGFNNRMNDMRNFNNNTNIQRTPHFPSQFQMEQMQNPIASHQMIPHSIQQLLLQQQQQQQQQQQRLPPSQQQRFMGNNNQYNNSYY